MWSAIQCLLIVKFEIIILIITAKITIIIITVTINCKEQILVNKALRLELKLPVYNYTSKK